jgi:DNA gyrase inhibitor GyrI
MEDTKAPANRIVPDQQAFLNVERDHPKASDAEKFRLAQADTLLRQCGYVRRKGGYGKKKSKTVRGN